MTKGFFASICILTAAVISFAQAKETFDIATFQTPKGWNKQAGQDSLRISTENGGDAFCLITIFKSIQGLSDPKENFGAAWETIVKEAVNVASEPEVTGPSPADNGWEAVVGAAPFEKDGIKGIAMLVTASGGGKMVNSLILTNSQNYESEIRAFLASIKLKTPDATPVRNAAKSGSDVSAIVGKWGMTSSDQTSPALGGGGYIARQYDFYPDGTYVFMIKTFAYTSRELLFTKETGKYRLVGNRLTITPQKGYIQSWTKGKVIESDGRTSETDKWGKLVKTQNRPLETVTYEISREYFSGIGEWQLVLRTSAPTQREGPFVSSSAFPNSYIYGTQKYPVEPPK